MSAETVDSRYMPSAATPVPPTGKILYRPVLEISKPARVDMTISPPINGSSCSPESIGSG